MVNTLHNFTQIIYILKILLNLLKNNLLNIYLMFPNFNCTLKRITKIITKNVQVP